MGAPIPPVYRADFERSVAAARAQLGGRTFALVWAQGRTMTPEQVLWAQGRATMPIPSEARPVPQTRSGDLESRCNPVCHRTPPCVRLPRLSGTFPGTARFTTTAIA